VNGMSNIPAQTLACAKMLLLSISSVINVAAAIPNIGAEQERALFSDAETNTKQIYY